MKTYVCDPFFKIYFFNKNEKKKASSWEEAVKENTSFVLVFALDILRSTYAQPQVVN